ncbi:hypothetical protein ACFY41_10510 [Streptomyces syringium]|uniref:hypothetical protein n=1 Tax=Streptomyces syringium TaxID=76729 RepID=UPI0036C92895
MPSFYEELMRADFSGLEKLAEKWEAVHREIEGLPKRMGDEVLKPLRDKGYWEGAAAPHAWSQIDDIQRQLVSAAKVSAAVAKVIRDGAGELKAAQRDLKGAVERARSKDLEVDGKGVVSTKRGNDAHAVQAMDDAQDEIIEIVRRGFLADENLSISLMADVGVGSGFNNAGPQLTDINHTSTLGVSGYNAISLDLREKDPYPHRRDEHPITLGLAWLGGSGKRDLNYTNGDALTELIRRSPSMERNRQEVLKAWQEKGEGAGRQAFSIAEDGYIGAGKKLLTEDLPAVVKNDKKGLGEAFVGSYTVQYEIKGAKPDGTLIVNYSMSNTTSVASLMHYVGYHSWMDNLNPKRGLPASNMTQNIQWTEEMPAHGSRNR